MLFPHAQNWRTSQLPYSLSLANSLHTGVTFDTASGAVAESQRWASRGMQGHGPRVQYPNRGMDGLGCGCGCDGGGGDGLGLLCIAAAVVALCWFRPAGLGG